MNYDILRIQGDLFVHFSVLIVFNLCEVNWNNYSNSSHIQAMLRAFFAYYITSDIEMSEAHTERSPTKHDDYAHAENEDITYNNYLHRFHIHCSLISICVVVVVSEYPVTDSFPWVSCCTLYYAINQFQYCWVFSVVCVICECRNDCVLARAPIIMNVKNTKHHIYIYLLRILF